jgi:hypothetical protein
MGRPRKIRSAKALADAWEAFKSQCDENTTRTVKDVEFTNADGTNVTHSMTEVSAPLSYTIVGFCGFLGISKSAWYKTYETDPKFVDIVARIHTECEIDVRSKFESGTINTRLAPLWMSKYGYGAKVETSQEHKADNNLLDAIKSSLDALGEGDCDE